jgi:hypothetical protein
MKTKIIALALLFLAASIFAIGPPALPMTFYGAVNATNGTAIGQNLTATLGASTQSTTINWSNYQNCMTCNYDLTIGRAPGDTTSTNVVFTLNSCNIANGTYASGVAVSLNMTVQSECLAPLCGDGTCNGAETCSTCPADCSPCPRLTVTKQIINDNGGTLAVGDATLRVDGSQVTSGVENTFASGAHIVSEDDVTGYAGTITGDCAADGTISLAPGDVKSCTITNDDNDLTPPFISIYTPANGVTYGNATLLVNITSDGNNVWYGFNGTNATYTVPVLVTFGEGQNTLVAYANDTAGNTNTTNVTFIVNTTQPAEPFCGDGTCNNGETCGTCASDCGACPPPAPPSGGGGGGGPGTRGVGLRTTYTPPAPPPPAAQEAPVEPLLPPPTPATPPAPFCGDDKCASTESCATCAADCGACRPAPVLGTGGAAEELAAEVPTNAQPQPLSITAQIANALGGEANIPLVAGGAVLGLLLLVLGLFLLLGRRKKKSL